MRGLMGEMTGYVLLGRGKLQATTYKRVVNIHDLCHLPQLRTSLIDRANWWLNLGRDTWWLSLLVRWGVSNSIRTDQNGGM